MSNIAEIESVLFKRVTGGYVFQAPNSWILGPKSRYRVNEAQKAQLLAIITPRRPIVRGAMIVAGIMAWTVAVSTMMWLATGREDPTGSDMVILSALLLVPMVLALMVALRRNLRCMQPILAGATPTEERISGSELRQAAAESISYNRALMIGGIWMMTCLLQIFILVLRNNRHPLFGDVQSYLAIATAVVAAGLALRHLLIALRKNRPGV